MKLYHGTSERFLDSILSNGITPRGKTKSNWSCESRSDLIYLSVAYPFYFAFSALKEEEKVVVIEIDSKKLDVDKFLPDEDFLGQLYGIEKTIEFRDNLELYSNQYEDSLNNLGNCAYYSIIKPSCISKYVIFDWKKRMTLSIEMLDPTISILNFKFTGNKYIDMVKWFFGYIDKLPQIETTKTLMEVFKANDQMLQLQTKALEFWTSESKNRMNINLCTL